MEIKLFKGDITTLDVDAIVNAANETLLGGGGVDGAIHRAAGPELVKESSRLGGCEPGDANITKGYRLPAKYVIHTVGPRYWKYTPEKAKELLRSCYIKSLEVAKENDLHSIAFPGISTGFFGYPLKEASIVAVNSIVEWKKANPDYELEVVFVAYNEETYQVYSKILKEIIENEKRS